MPLVLEAEKPATISLSAYGQARSTIQGSPLSPTNCEKPMLTGERASTWRSG